MAVLKDLIVHGASRFINVAQYSSAQGGVIAADKGVFNKLIATNAEINTLNVEELNADRLTAQNATVMGLLDVQGELHTNSWTNSNIATIQGNFYIAPTVMTGTSSGDTGVTITAITNGSAANGYWTLVLSGTNILVDTNRQTTTLPDLESDVIDESDTNFNAWSSGSAVMITGSIKKNGITYPLGTLKGVLSGEVSTSGATITKITDNLNNNPSTLQEYGAGTYGFVEIKISLYKRWYNSSFYPLGILMSAQGRASKTFIDIYGGGNITHEGILVDGNNNSASTDYGGLAMPNVRIGNLRGLPNVYTGDFTDDNNCLPKDWGIYTDNGYFKGTVVAEHGVITSDVHIGGISTNELVNNLNTAYAQSIEYIESTQSSATSVWTGVTRDAFLYPGKTISYHLGQNGNNSPATLQLTLNDSTTTENIPIVMNNDTPITNQYEAGAIINMTFSGSEWKITGSTKGLVNQTQYDINLIAAGNISAGRIICGTASGYKDIQANMQFDLSYPLLYAKRQILQGALTGIRNDNYLSINDINFSISGTITSGGNGKVIYLKGTVADNQFFVSSAPYLTTTPTSNSSTNYYYIPIGTMNSATTGYFNSSKELYAFRGGIFTPVSNAISKYITDISEGGIKVQQADSLTNYIIIDSYGLNVYKSNPSNNEVPISVASFGAEARIGLVDNMHVEIKAGETGEVGFYKAAGDTNKVAWITNEQLFITRTTVQTRMELGMPVGFDSTRPNAGGQWSWCIHENAEDNNRNNLYLKWIG